MIGLVDENGLPFRSRGESWEIVVPSFVDSTDRRHPNHKVFLKTE